MFMELTKDEKRMSDYLSQVVRDSGMDYVQAVQSFVEKKFHGAKQLTEYWWADNWGSAGGWATSSNDKWFSLGVILLFKIGERYLEVNLSEVQPTNWTADYSISLINGNLWLKFYNQKEMQERVWGLINNDNLVKLAKTFGARAR